MKNVTWVCGALILLFMTILSASPSLVHSIDIEPKEGLKWRVDTEMGSVTIFHNNTAYGILGLSINSKGAWYSFRDFKDLKVEVLENATDRLVIKITSYINVTNAMPEGWVVDVKQWLEFKHGPLTYYNVTIHPRTTPPRSGYTIHLLSMQAVNKVFDKMVADGEITTSEYATYSKYASVHSEKDGIGMGVIIMSVKPETANFNRYQRVSVKEQWVNAYEIENETLSPDYYTLSSILYFDKSSDSLNIKKLYEQLTVETPIWVIRLQGPGFTLSIDVGWFSVGLGFGCSFATLSLKLYRKYLNRENND